MGLVGGEAGLSQSSMHTVYFIDFSTFKLTNFLPPCKAITINNNKTNQ